MVHVDPLGHVLRPDFARDLVGGALHGLRVFVGQLVLGQDGVHLGVVVARVSQHVDHLSEDVLVVGVGPLGDLDHSPVVGLAALELALGYDDVVHEEVVGGDEVGQVAVHLETAHKLVLGAVEDLDDLGLLDVLLPARHEAHLHAVAVEGSHGVALRDEDGLVAAVGHEGVLAVRLADEGALLHLSLCVEPIGVVAVLGDEVVPFHFLHDVDGQHLQWVCIEMERLENLLERQALARLRDKQFFQLLAELFLGQALA